MAADIVHLAWAIEQRAEIQRSLLALLVFARAHASESLEMADKYLFDHLVGAAFSLWRAAFLAETMREEQDIHQSQEQFLEKVIADNMITFTDDKLNRHWTVEYYLENAKLRLMRAIELSDHYKKTKLHEALTSFLRLRGTQGVELTEYEWECAHYVLRNIFRVLAPDSNLKIVKPGLPNRER